jgi:hypothetical protein
LLIEKIGVAPKQVSANRAKRLQNLAFIIKWNPKNQNKTIAYCLFPIAYPNDKTFLASPKYLKSRNQDYLEKAAK